jgi:hypothetical protein
MNNRLSQASFQILNDEGPLFVSWRQKCHKPTFNLHNTKHITKVGDEDPVPVVDCRSVLVLNYVIFCVITIGGGG